MHIQYAAESVKRQLNNRWTEESKKDHQAVEVNVTEPELLSAAEKIGDAKAASIVATICKNKNNRYAKTTAAQKWALTTALLTAHGTAVAVYAAAYGITAEEFQKLVDEAE